MRGVEIINCVNCVGLLEKMTLEQRLKGGETVAMWISREREFQVSAKAICMAPRQNLPRGHVDGGQGVTGNSKR